MAGPPKQQRYNAKARQSVAGGSSHKKRRHSAGPSSQQQPDSNRDIIDPNSAEDQEWREKEAKRRELLAASQEDPEQKLNSKKRKRLDAYIASRLKKEARADLLEELAQTSAQVRENRQDLVSTRTLGTGKGKSARELLQSVSKSADPYIDEDDDDDDEEDFEGQEVLRPPPVQQQQQHDERPTGEVLDDPERRQRILDAAALFAPPSSKPASAAPGSALASGALGLGSALARGPDGQPLMPVMRTRKRKGPSQRERKRLREQAEKEAAEEEDSDFDSSASSSDGDDEDDDDDAASEEDETAAPAVAAPDNDKEAAASDEETDSEGEAILMEAMRRRGLPAESEDDDDSSDGGHPGSDEETDSEGAAVLREAMRLRGLPDESEDDDDDSDAGDDSERDTDSEEEIVLLEAMRRRGLALPSEDEGDSSGSDEEEDDDASEQGDESREASFELGLAGEAPRSAAMDEDAKSEAESLPWEGFGSEDDGEGASEADGEEEEDGSDEEEGEDDGDVTAVADEPSRRRGIQRTDRSSGFKDWARSALGFGGEGKKARDEEGRPLEPVAGLSVKVSDLGPNDGVARGPLGEDEAPPSALSPFAAKYYEEVSSTKAVRNVPVHRSQDIIEARLRLPVVQEEERVVKTILENEVTVICGETGSGKTTQVAQMLFERGFGTPGSDNPGLVGITQPRRVAAVSTARRVAEELNLTHDRVSHQVRFDATVSPETSLKFMTDGVLLRELAADLLLSRYSVVIVDEAHERSVNTDVLIGVLSRIVRLRAKRWVQGTDSTTRPLRLVIMSATLRVADFVENATLFPKPPPLLKIEARQHPVTVHFNRKTPHDYIEEAVKKAGKIHTRLPPGGILIFMTGEQEIRTVCQRLEAKFGRNRKGGQKRGGRVEEASKARPGQEGLEAEDVTLGAQDDDQAQDDLPDGDADDEALDTDDEASADGDEADLEDEAHRAAAAEEARAASSPPMHILPLYSMLSSERQLQVFQPPPEDSRLVVVATNVAETSLTIPNIRYVVDCGRAKERKYDASTSSSGGISSFRVDWISKASAAQRAGRAGRTGPGHCYRLYSSNVYEEYLDEFAEAEIRRTPVEGLVLQMKAMNIDNVVHFPFPTPPDREAIARAERVLVRLGALKLEVEQKTRREVARITELGRTMSLFPLSPRYAKLLVQGQQHGCLPYVVALVAALTVGELFVRDEGAQQQEGDDAGEAEQEDDEDEDTIKQGKSAGAKAAENAAKEERKETRRRRFAALERFDSLGGQGISDAFRALAVVGAHGFAGKEGSAAFCEENFIRPKAMDELTSLRSQLSSLVLSTLDSSRETEILSRSLNANASLPPPSDTQLKVLRQLIACAYIDQVAVRADVAAEAARNVPALAYEAAEGRLSSRIRKARTCRWVPYLAAGVVDEAAYVHPSSAIYEHDPPEWCVFSEVTRSMPKKRKSSSKDGEDRAVVDEEEEEEEQLGRVYLRGLTKINPAWIAKLGKDLCSFSKPEAIGNVATSATSLSEHDVVLTPTYGTGPACDPGNKSVGWELPPIKAKRRWVGGAQGWKVDL